MNDKKCPFCLGRAKIKPLLDPFKKSNSKNRLRLYDYACGTEGCYLETGAGYHVEKGNIEILDHMWKSISDYVEVVKIAKKPVAKIVKKPIKKAGKPYIVHFSMNGQKDNISCSSRSHAHAWSDEANKVTCPRCIKTQNVQYLLTHKEVS